MKRNLAPKWDATRFDGEPESSKELSSVLSNRGAKRRRESLVVSRKGGPN